MTVRDPAWRQQEETDWSDCDPEDIDFPEDVPETPVDEHDRRYDDYVSTRDGDIGDESLPPF